MRPNCGKWPIPACLWFLARDRSNDRFRDWRGEILFIDARGLGHMVDRTHRDFDEEDIVRVAGTYQAWRSKEKNGYADVSGFCKSTSLDEVGRHDGILAPGRYVGREAPEEDDEPFEQKMNRLVVQLYEAVRNNVTIDWAVRENVRAKLRLLVKRILRRHGYPPDKQEKATKTVLEQAEGLSAEWLREPGFGREAAEGT